MKPRFIEKRLPALPARRLVIVTGARQTGKTTLVRRVYPALRYVNLDSPENRDLVRALSTFNWVRDMGPCVLDEAQKEPSVFEKVKYAYDEGQLDFTALLGSSQILLMKQVRESLAGRTFVYELWPLMLCEAVLPDGTASVEPPLLARLLESPDISAVLSAIPSVVDGPLMARLRDAEAHLLRWGGMPELLRLSDDDRRTWLRSYAYTYLERDLADLARIADLEPFRKLQQLAALRSTRLLNYSELSRDAGISVDTSRRYLEYLRLSYQAILIQPFAENLTSATVKTPKLYWSDMGLLRHLTGMTDSLTGEQFENYIAAEIWKWIKTSDSGTEVFFYRTRGGLEVDLLLRTPHGLLGIEVKSRDRVVSGDIAGLRRLAEAAGPRWRGGLCIYRGHQIQPLDKADVWAIPSWRLLGMP